MDFSNLWGQRSGLFTGAGQVLRVRVAEGVGQAVLVVAPLLAVGLGLRGAPFSLDAVPGLLLVVSSPVPPPPSFSARRNSLLRSGPRRISFSRDGAMSMGGVVLLLLLEEGCCRIHGERDKTEGGIHGDRESQRLGGGGQGRTPLLASSSSSSEVWLLLLVSEPETAPPPPALPLALALLLHVGLTPPGGEVEGDPPRPGQQHPVPLEAVPLQLGGAGQVLRVRVAEGVGQAVLRGGTPPRPPAGTRSLRSGPRRISFSRDGAMSMGGVVLLLLLEEGCCRIHGERDKTEGGHAGAGEGALTSLGVAWWGGVLARRLLGLAADTGLVNRESRPLRWTPTVGLLASLPPAFHWVLWGDTHDEDKNRR
ncbi:hypothetical protein CRUP_006579 [Coryphaenoides rupestris]|nr:hypothetical protein CRUP_006579 [Coryphaenoides rupestris]